MKHKLAARGAAAALAAMLAAGFGTGNVREAMASVHIPAQKVISVSQNGAGKVTVTPSLKAAAAESGIDANPADKTEQDASYTTKESAKADSSGQENSSTVQRIEEGEDSSMAQGAAEENSSGVSGQNSTNGAVSPIPKAVEEADQKKMPEKPLASLSEEKKAETPAAKEQDTDQPEKNEETESAKTAEKEDSEPVQREEQAPGEVNGDPAAQKNDKSLEEPDTIKTEEADQEAVSESTEDESAVKERQDDGEKQAGKPESDSSHAEWETATPTPTVDVIPAKISSEPAPKPDIEAEPEANAKTDSEAEEEIETVLVGYAGGAKEAATVSAASGATQLVGDTTKNYSIDTPAGAQKTESTASGGSRKALSGDLLAQRPGTAEKSSSENEPEGSQKEQKKTAVSYAGRQGGNAGSSAQTGTTAGNSQRKLHGAVRTSTPQTGDHSGIVLYTILAGASLAAAAAAAILLKHSRKPE